MVPTVQDTGWFTSSYSNAGGDQCVAVRITSRDGVGVRDSKAPATGAFWVTSSAWTAFVSQITAGGLDLSARP